MVRLRSKEKPTLRLFNMYQSKFLLNRQKIFNPLEIHTAIASYLAHLPPGERGGFFYRLEWYRIGISLPMLVYSDAMPLMKVMPECQLLETTLMTNLPASSGSLSFMLFAVPEPTAAIENVIDEKAIAEWFQGQLGATATLTDAQFGPNNCLYYQKSGAEHQQQTVSIKGTMQVNDLAGLETLRRQPLGGCSELGCGLLYLSE